LGANMRKSFVFGLSILAIGSGIAYAQNVDVIKQRRDAMKAIATNGTPPFQMMKGSVPFELAKVQTGLKTYQEQGAKLKALFPDDSKTGGDTDAPAKIWSEKAEFEKAIETFVSTAKSAEAAIKDEATFKAEYPKVAASCGGCHKDADGFAPKLGDSMKKMNSQK
jgi:cytochrome c556